jgi:hypothetical protein
VDQRIKIRFVSATGYDITNKNTGWEQKCYSDEWENTVNSVNVRGDIYIYKVKQSRYTPWRRLGGEEI